jgi:hypothetical protein
MAVVAHRLLSIGAREQQKQQKHLGKSPGVSFSGMHGLGPSLSFNRRTETQGGYGVLVMSPRLPPRLAEAFFHWPLESAL